MTDLQVDHPPALIDQVHDRLLAAIVDGTLPPGSRLTQESAADMLGVSRQPVSHALQVLKRRGLLIEHGRKGLAVSNIEAQRVRDLYQVRAALDGLAAELSAERVRNGLVSKRERADTTKYLQAGLSLGPDAAIVTLIAADVGFHSAIYRLSGNAAITETVAEQWPHFMRSMGVVLRGGSQRVVVWTEHATILTAIFAGDPVQAGRLARAHAEKAGRETAGRLESGADPSLAYDLTRAAAADMNLPR
jgi:DNA-binding GntR family transcriptional regulator